MQPRQNWGSGAYLPKMSLQLEFSSSLATANTVAFFCPLPGARFISPADPEKSPRRVGLIFLYFFFADDA